ncbi:hypothetical protein CRG98_004018, partial [Punica granatum]
NRNGRKGRSCQSVIPIPPPRSPVPTKDADGLGGGVGVGASNRRPQPLHRGRRRPLWVLATSFVSTGDLGVSILFQD